MKIHSITKGSLIAFFLVVMAIPIWGVAQSESTRGLEISLKQPGRPFVKGDPIRLGIILTNVSGSEIILRLAKGPGLGDRMFRYDLVKSDGKGVARWRDLQPEKFVIHPGDSTDSAIVRIQPNESFTTVAFLGTIFRVDEEGSYNAKVSFDDEKRNYHSVSNEVTIQITGGKP